jgi:hypothetical protein
VGSIDWLPIQGFGVRFAARHAVPYDETHHDFYKERGVQTMACLDYWVGSLHFSEVFGDETVRRLNDLAPIQACDGNEYKIRAEHVMLHEVPLDYECKYKILIDRSSYMYPQAQGLFMGFAFRGVYVINNPFSFYYYLRNKDAGYLIARELGITIPKTFLLPPKVVPGFTQADYKYHRYFDWDAMGRELGWPLVIKPAEGREAMGVHVVHNLGELLQRYDESGTQVMMLQQFVKSPHPWQIRCLCIGRKIIPIKYIFRQHDASEYIFDECFLSSELGKKVIDTCKIINQVMGYEMNSVEFFISEQGELHAIDFNNPVPDGRYKALGDIFHRDYQEAMCTLVQDIVAEQRSLDFIPSQVNAFAEIARRPDLSASAKFDQALRIANRYYEKPANTHASVQ